MSMPAQSLPSAVAGRWFDDIEPCADPWWRWLETLQFPPTDAAIEYYVEDACRAAECRRRRSSRTCGRPFVGIMNGWKAIGIIAALRALTWRAAALRVAFDFGLRFDDGDGKCDIAVRLAQTMRALGPYDADGYYDGGNLWKPSTLDRDGTPEKPDPLDEYAAMVLVLARVTVSAWR
jgi:hypothetical protein